MGNVTMDAYFQPTSQYRETLTLIILIYTLHVVVILHYRLSDTIRTDSHQPPLSLLTASASAYSHACPLLGSTFSPNYQPSDLLPYS